jgi:hypothetical protein
MVCSIQNYWVFLFCPSSGILKFLEYFQSTFTKRTMDKVQKPSNSEKGPRLKQKETAGKTHVQVVKAPNI